MNEPELRLGRREESLLSHPRAAQSRDMRVTLHRGLAPLLNHCLFSLALSHPMNNLGTATAGAEEPGFGGRQPGLGELVQAKALCWCISHLESSRLHRHPLIIPWWRTGSHESESFVFPPQ